MQVVSKTLALIFLLSLAVACATGHRGDGVRTRNVRAPISMDELETVSQYENAWEAVRRLRPRWLGVSPVYLDNVRIGDSNALVDIPLAAVREIRYFNAADATTRWGTGHAGGAIEVITTGPAG